MDSGGGYYRLESRHSGKVLDFPSTADRAGLNQWADRSGTNQQFRLADSAGGFVRLLNRASARRSTCWPSPPPTAPSSSSGPTPAARTSSGGS